MARVKKNVVMKGLSGSLGDQVVIKRDKAGRTIVSASSIDEELKSKLEGKNKTEQARLVGEVLAERAKAAGVKEVVFDRGGYRYIGRVKALADSAREAGLEF